MADVNELRDPWLVAAWPGMGSIALLAGGYLAQQLGAQPVAELNARDFFEIQNVDVADGIATPGRLPRSIFFEWRDPRGQRDLLIFVGEAQPTSNGYGLCQKLIEYAERRGVRRLFTFAAMATQLQLGTQPRVYAGATDNRALREAVGVHGVEAMESGQISGLNGVLLAAGGERNIRGTCLLGELPYFAVGVPNPRGAKAVLEAFSQMAGIDIEFDELDRQARSVEKQLKQLLRQMHQAAGEAVEAAGLEGASEFETDEDEDGDEPTEGEQEPQHPPLDPRIQNRIEGMFDHAERDRSKAFELKQELDRLGVFEQYEDRFLDLFRKAD
ncbi:MAG: hypothetical protein AMXMBFR13_05740 [Phycisphaerae bacterium]